MNLPPLSSPLPASISLKTIRTAQMGKALQTRQGDARGCGKMKHQSKDTAHVTCMSPRYSFGLRPNRGNSYIFSCEGQEIRTPNTSIMLVARSGFTRRVCTAFAVPSPMRE